MIYKLPVRDNIDRQDVCSFKKELKEIEEDV